MKALPQWVYAELWRRDLGDVIVLEMRLNNEKMFWKKNAYGLVAIH